MGTPSTDNTILECVDGTTISLFLPNAWDQCGNHGGLIRCPTSLPVMFEDNSTQYADHQCAATVADCVGYGGPRYCGTTSSPSPSPTAMVSPSTAPSPISYPTGVCPWMQSTSDDHTLFCNDGSTCDVTSDHGWPCCDTKGGRLQCPAGTTMCAEPCTSEGNDFCCMADCAPYGGALGCKCSAATDTTGYTNIVEGDLDYASLNVTAECDEPQYLGNASVVCNTSSAPGVEPYILTGCEADFFEEVLFQSPGSSTTYKNQWAGWYSSSSSYTVSSGTGKRGAYNTKPITKLRFSDAGGGEVVYQLTSAYAGRTLLSIVQGCMGSSRTNNGNSVWDAGFCTNVGTKVSSTGRTYSNLRIGVGDGSSDGADWALFMVLSGNGAGDFTGANIYCFGGEGEANNGYLSGTVYIHGE